MEQIGFVKSEGIRKTRVILIFFIGSANSWFIHFFVMTYKLAVNKLWKSMLSKSKSAFKKIQLNSASDYEKVKRKKQVSLTSTSWTAILNVCFIFTPLISYSNIVAIIVFTWSISVSFLISITDDIFWTIGKVSPRW